MSPLVSQFEKHLQLSHHWRDNLCIFFVSHYAIQITNNESLDIQDISI